MAVPVAERLAGRLALSRRLRGKDAVQLAAAMTLREHMRLGVPGSEVVVVVAFDRRLLEAAEREGSATLGDPLDQVADRGGRYNRPHRCELSGHCRILRP